MRCKNCQYEKDLIIAKRLDGPTPLCRDARACVDRAADKMRMQVYVQRNRGNPDYQLPTRRR